MHSLISAKLFSFLPWQESRDIGREKITDILSAFSDEELAQLGVENALADAFNKTYLPMAVIQAEEIQLSHGPCIEVPLHLKHVEHARITQWDVHVQVDGHTWWTAVRPRINLKPTYGLSLSTSELLFQVFTIDQESPDRAVENVIAEINGSLEILRGYLEEEWLWASLDQSPRLEQKCRDYQSRNLVASRSKYFVREREDRPQTFDVPEIRRKIAPGHETLGTTQIEMERELESAHYEHILNVIAQMGRVIELSPTAFRHMTEPELRFLLLVPLSG